MPIPRGAPKSDSAECASWWTREKLKNMEELDGVNGFKALSIAANTAKAKTADAVAVLGSRKQLPTGAQVATWDLATANWQPAACDQCARLEMSPRQFKKCSRCHVATYCSAACQKLAWVDGGHKEACEAGASRVHADDDESSTDADARTAAEDGAWVEEQARGATPLLPKALYRQLWADLTHGDETAVIVTLERLRAAGDAGKRAALDENVRTAQAPWRFGKELHQFAASLGFQATAAAIQTALEYSAASST